MPVCGSSIPVEELERLLLSPAFPAAGAKPQAPHPPPIREGGVPWHPAQAHGGGAAQALPAQAYAGGARPPPPQDLLHIAPFPLPAPQPAAQVQPDGQENHSGHQTGSQYGNQLPHNSSPAFDLSSLIAANSTPRRPFTGLLTVPLPQLKRHTNTTQISSLPCCRRVHFLSALSPAAFSAAIYLPCRQPCRLPPSLSSAAFPSPSLLSVCHVPLRLPSLFPDAFPSVV